MAVASKKQSRTAGKGVKSPKRKTAKKSRTKSSAAKTKTRRGNMRLVKKPGRKKSRRSKFKGSKEISIARVIARANGGALVLACEGWTAQNSRGDEFIGRRPSWCIGLVEDEDWSNLNNIDESSVLIRSLSNGRDGLVDEMLEEYEEERREFNGEYEADDDDDDDDDEDDEDEDDDDYDD